MGDYRGYSLNSYLEDFVSRLTIGIIRVTIWVIGVIKLRTMSP